MGRGGRAMTAVDSFAGPRVELARHLTSAGERVIYAVRVGGMVVVSDWPSDAPGGAFVIERGVTCQRELYALVTDYVDQSIELAAIVRVGDDLAKRRSAHHA